MLEEKSYVGHNEDGSEIEVRLATSTYTKDGEYAKPYPNFTDGNAKMKLTEEAYSRRVFVFDIPAGYTCPMANLCKSFVGIKVDGHAGVVDLGKFRCYAVKAESVYENVRKSRWSNYHETQAPDFVEKVVEILSNKRKRARAPISIRIHSSGDYYSWEYFQKWVQIAKALPEIEFWGYTKQASFVRWLRDNPMDNFKLVYSHGGLMDSYAEKHGLPQVYVVAKGESPRSDAPIICTTDNPCNDYEWINYEKGSFSLNFH